MAKYHIDEYLNPSPVVYGSIALDPLTWDADKIQGCIVNGSYGFNITTITNRVCVNLDMKGNDNYLCSNETDVLVQNISSPIVDSSYCHKYECPFGYNVRLLDRIASISNYSNFVPEIQEFICNARTGYFVLSFRGAETSEISVTSTLTEFQNILQQTATIGKVTLTAINLHQNSESPQFTNNNPICNYYNHPIINITYISNLGLVPLLSVTQISFRRNDYVSVNRIQEGSVAGLLECSGRGNCNRDTGTCDCFEYYTSSDGFGNPGNRNDCGHNTIY
jgi:hypothetical protein